MRKHLLAAFLFVSVLNVKSQSYKDSIKIFIPVIDSVCNDSFVTVPIKCKNFTNILTWFGTIEFDKNILKIDSYFLNKNIPHIADSNSTFNTLVDSSIGFMYTEPWYNFSLKDSTTLFSIRFKILNQTNQTKFKFTNSIYLLGLDTAADIVNLFDLGSLIGKVYFQDGQINFVDTPKIIQNGNVFTCLTNCPPLIYLWKVYDCNGVLIQVDSTLINTYTSTQPSGSCYSITCAARSSNGRTTISRVTPNILPLKLTSFNLTQTPTNVILNWKTTNEINVSYFNIQKSNNGKDFSNIGKVNAGKMEYSFTDEKLAITNEKLTIFYRLEIVDKDGSKTYSEIKQITTNDKPQTINVFPNPSKGNITIETKNVKEIVIVDGIGRTMQKQIINNQFSVLNIQLKSGSYFIKALLKNGEIKVEKLLVE